MQLRLGQPAQKLTAGFAHFSSVTSESNSRKRAEAI
jgi:hypothetical protein